MTNEQIISAIEVLVKVAQLKTPTMIEEPSNAVPIATEKIIELINKLA